MVITLIRTYAAYAVNLEHLLLLQKERIRAEKSRLYENLPCCKAEKDSLKSLSKTCMKS